MLTGRVGLTTPDKGVSDMTSIPDIDETGINRNLKVRYEKDDIYVSILNKDASSKIDSLTARVLHIYGGLTAITADALRISF